MKSLIKDNFLVILAAISLIFLIVVYFVGLQGEGSIFTVLGSSVGNTTAEMNIVDMAEEIERANTIVIPTIHYIGGTRKVGDIVALEDLFKAEYEDGTIVNLADTTDLKVVLKDVRDKEDNLVVTKLTTENIEALEDIPTSFVYDKEQDILYFHKSGIFTVYIMIYSESGSGVLYQFAIPVEVG